MINHAYIHIPFCIRKCNYCDFISGFDIKFKAPYINALLKEIKQKYNGEKLKTLYIGGGTPSLLNYDDLKNILDCFNFYSLCEITLEANPETIEKDKFKSFYQIGINRLSIGIQTFNNDILNIIGRLHNEKVINNSVETVKNIGFNNINIDLIYGLPNQTLNLVKKDLEKADALDIEHISTYGLKIEENSYFYKNPPLNIPDDEMQADMYSFICEFLNKHKFIHYEISNFSKENYSSIHNCAYWKNKNYYGFGVNASGYEGNIRYKNISDFNKYINNPFLKEEEIHLTKENQLEEEIFLALRLKKGINIQEINKKYNIDFMSKYKNIIEKYNKLKLLTHKNNSICLTEKGMAVSNEIMSDFI